jgi:glycine/D-amino acid oxidase-like deaminating enzyme
MIMNLKTNFVICGAGIAGISTAYWLAVKYGQKNIVLVDYGEPLGLTSDKSSECYRNWWPDEAMIRLMNRSLDLLEELNLESKNAFPLNQRGYLYVTKDNNSITDLIENASSISSLGGGKLRIHTGDADQIDYSPFPSDVNKANLTGADILLNPQAIHSNFPFLAKQTAAVLHARRAGWFSAQQFGNYLLGKVREHGVTIIRGKIVGLTQVGGQIRSVRLADGSIIHTDCFINAAGPFLSEVAAMAETQLPVYCELHLKTMLRDNRGVLPRSAPLIINSDSEVLPWNSDEKGILDEVPETRFLTKKLPGGAHTRPEGGDDSPMVLALWDYHTERIPPILPLPLDDIYPEIVIRGIAQIIPEFAYYYQHPLRPIVDGGYYTRTVENRPLIGPLALSGTWVNGAYAGFGIMAACAGAELIAAQVLGTSSAIPKEDFLLERYENHEYQERLKNWNNSGQL